MDIPIAYRKQILFVGIFGIVVYAGYNEANHSVTNYKRGLLAAAFVLVSQGILDQYTGPFTKRFPRFWRGVSRYTLLYLAVMIFILFQTAADARALMAHLYPELGKPLVSGMHSYEVDCELTWPRFLDDLDHYYLMHLVGWFVSALMIRDVYVLHFWSVLDEILELSWQHILPHLAECWWDHIIVDLMLSNTPAIYLGLFVIKKAGLREFDWLGRKGKKSIKDWDIFTNHRRFGCCIMLVVIMISNFLTGFFIMNSLWVPPKNFLNIYRLSVWFLLGSIAIGELYDDVATWATPQRLTTPISNEYRWICCGVTLVEAMISYKFRHDTGNTIDAPTPWYIWLPWLISIAIVIGYYLYLRFIREQRTTKGGDSAWEIEERRKNSTRLADKEKKQKVKAEEQPAAANPIKAAVAEVKKEVANLKDKVKGQDNQKKQENKAQAAPAKAAEPEKKKNNKKGAEADDDEWKVAGTKGTKQQKQPQKQQKQEVEEEEREEEPVTHAAAPVEDEWKEIKGPKTVKKNKKKRD